MGPVESRRPLPGEFFTILPVQYPSPMIRRPFAYSGWKDGQASFIYEIRGRGTQDLARLRIGDSLDWLGPLGTSFPMPPSGSRPVIIAGGIGLGPLYYLAGQLAAAGLQPLLITGSRDVSLVPRLTLPPEVEWRICTDDGSAGIRGTVLNALNENDLKNAVLYSCGPQTMMAAVHQLALRFERPCWVSLEEMMACAVGACQGCAVAVVDSKSNSTDPSRVSYKRVCIEGPVFNSREIQW